MQIAPGLYEVRHGLVLISHLAVPAAAISRSGADAQTDFVARKIQRPWGNVYFYTARRACQLDQERVDYDISSRPRRAGVNLERQPHQLVHRRVAKAVGWAGGAPRHTGSRGVRSHDYRGVDNSKSKNSSVLGHFILASRNFREGPPTHP